MRALPQHNPRLGRRLHVLAPRLDLLRRLDHPAAADVALAALRRRRPVDRQRHRNGRLVGRVSRSEEHTSELQSLMRTSYAVSCLKKTSTRQKKISML